MTCQRAGRSACSTLNSTVLPSKPHEQEIINTLLTLKSKAYGTQKSIAQSLRHLQRHADLMNPDKVKAYIDDALNERTKQPLNNNTKRKLTSAYDHFCNVNRLEWTKPRYKSIEITPIIPTTENITKIISASTLKMTTVFTLMKDIGCNAEELHRTPRKQIDTEQAIISITGTKGHDSKAYKLKPQTLTMLINYLARHQQEYPFPRSRNVTRAWINARKQVAHNLSQPELNNIPLRALRNYSGAIFYKTHKKDPIETMRHLRHKKLTTTQHYLKAIILDEPEEYITVAIQLGQPDTQKKIIEYSNAGYEKLTDADDYLYMRALKTT